MTLALGEDRDQDVGACHLLAAGGLHMDHCALDDALESGRRLGVVAAVGDEVLELGLQIGAEASSQLVEVDVAGPHHRGGVLIVDQREQKVLQRRVFVVAFVGERKRPVKRLFETAREGWHQILFVICIWLLYWALSPRPWFS